MSNAFSVSAFLRTLSDTTLYNIFMTWAWRYTTCFLFVKARGLLEKQVICYVNNHFCQISRSKAQHTDQKTKPEKRGRNCRALARQIFRKKVICFTLGHKSGVNSVNCFFLRATTKPYCYHFTYRTILSTGLSLLLHWEILEGQEIVLFINEFTVPVTILEIYYACTRHFLMNKWMQKQRVKVQVEQWNSGTLRHEFIVYYVWVLSYRFSYKLENQNQGENLYSSLCVWKYFVKYKLQI